MISFVLLALSCVLPLPSDARFPLYFKGFPKLTRPVRQPWLHLLNCAHALGCAHVYRAVLPSAVCAAVALAVIVQELLSIVWVSQDTTALSNRLVSEKEICLPVPDLKMGAPKRRPAASPARRR